MPSSLISKETWNWQHGTALPQILSNSMFINIYGKPGQENKYVWIPWMKCIPSNPLKIYIPNKAWLSQTNRITYLDLNLWFYRGLVWWKKAHTAHWHFIFSKDRTDFFLLHCISSMRSFGKHFFSNLKSDVVVLSLNSSFIF